jgi:predicted secreted Zn-dependent protease
MIALMPVILAWTLLPSLRSGSTTRIYSAVLDPAAAALPPTYTPAPTASVTQTSTAAGSPTPTITPSPTLTLTPAPELTSTRATTEETRGPVTLRLNTIHTRYQIAGYSQMDLELQMRALGPTDDYSGIHWYAITRPGFDWEQAGSCSDQGCAPGQVTIILTIQYVLPRWDAPANADPALIADWAVFESALVTHETGHGDRAIACAWRIGEAQAALSPAPDEDELEYSMRVTAEGILAACRDEQRAYENETNHGRTQGVYWGP